MSRQLSVAILSILLSGTTCGGSSSSGEDREKRLDAASTWMYQLSGLDDQSALEVLAATDYPILVIEPGQNHRPCTDFNPAEYGIPEKNRDDACANVYDTKAIVSALRQTPSGEKRLLIAYIDMGQAEWYRDYWEKGWAPPTLNARGTPEFILAADPDGWTGNFVVAYWHEEWKNLWLGEGEEQGIVAELAELGFDGVYLDWVEAYDDDVVRSAAMTESVDPAEEMIQFVEEIREAGREVTSDFLVIAQNATYLLDDGDTSRYAATIDALAVEDTWFYGNGSTEDWTAGEDTSGYSVSDREQCERTNCSVTIVAPDNVCPNEDETEVCKAVSGDLHGGVRHACEAGEVGTSNCWSTENRLAAYDRYLAAGIPVFTVDYCISQENADVVYQESRAAGFRRQRPIHC